MCAMCIVQWPHGNMKCNYIKSELVRGGRDGKLKPTKTGGILVFDQFYTKFWLTQKFFDF